MKKFLIFLIVCTVAFTAQASELCNDRFVVVIDRGHSTVDQGAQVGEDTEYGILSSLVAQLTGEVKESIEVIYYNASGEHLTIDERATRINALNPDLVISIHMGNSKNGPRQAAIILNENNTGFEKSKGFANQLINNLVNDVYFSTVRTEVENMSLLEKVNAPAFMLEIGNMNAPRDRYYLQTTGAGRLSINFTAFLNELN
ncbi:MAG: N-acetylmuramoyl-L-alanine amidase [Nonlabens sp.]|uniref:N-acetylmuramoyl-L-alanine amidase n=1 Tax=Nonlabens sp. TaxID=1888209 RepID=UPI003EF8FA62